jgi:hypothetical protein
MLSPSGAARPARKSFGYCMSSLPVYDTPANGWINACLTFSLAIRWFDDSIMRPVFLTDSALACLLRLLNSFARRLLRKSHRIYPPFRFIPSYIKCQDCHDFISTFLRHSNLSSKSAPLLENQPSQDIACNQPMHVSSNQYHAISEHRNISYNHHKNHSPNIHRSLARQARSKILSSKN